MNMRATKVENLEEDKICEECEILATNVKSIRVSASSHSYVIYQMKIIIEQHILK